MRVLKTTQPYGLSTVAAMIHDHSQCFYELRRFPTTCSKLLWANFSHMILHTFNWCSALCKGYLIKFWKTSSWRTNDLDSWKVWTTYFFRLRCFLYILLYVFIQYSSGWPWSPISFGFQHAKLCPRNFLVPRHCYTVIFGNGDLSTLCPASTVFLYYSWWSIHFSQGIFSGNVVIGF